MNNERCDNGFNTDMDGGVTVETRITEIDGEQQTIIQIPSKLLPSLLPKKDPVKIGKFFFFDVL